MAKAKKTQKTVDTWKKKRWHRIIAPKLFNEQILGETPALEPKDIIGRTVSLSLMNLTRDIKKQNVQITFEIDKVMGDTGFTHVKSIQLAPPSIKRQVKRRKDRIDDSFVCTTADNLPVRVKPFLVTINSASNSVGVTLRKAAKNYIKKKFLQLPYEVLLKDIVSKRFQSIMKKELQKIYPLKSCEIRGCILEMKGRKISDVRKEVMRPEHSEEEKQEKKEEKKEVKEEKPDMKEDKRTEKPAEKKEKKEEKKETKE